MRTRITKRVVDTAKPGPRDAFLWDTDVRGFGVKVTPAGDRIYVLQYRTGGRGTPVRRYTIGRHGSPWTPDTARTEARRLLGLVAGGTDPAAEKSAARARATCPPDGLTWNGLIDVYAERKMAANRSGPETVRVLRVNFPTLADRRLEAITEAVAVAAVADIVAGRGPVMANRSLAYAKAMMTWANAPQNRVHCPGVAGNPFAAIGRPAPEQSRHRVLSDEEIRWVWKAADVLGYPFGPLVQLLILTLQRRDECSGLRLSEVDLPARLWTIPAERAKNGRAHLVPLSGPAMRIVRAVPVTDDLLFTHNERTPVSGFNWAKRRLDAEIACLRAKAAEAKGEDPTRLTPMPHWQFHDLRRTGTTGLARLGVPPHVADKILNHSGGEISGVRQVYNRFDYLEERRAALEMWAAHVAGLTGERPAPSRTRRVRVDRVLPRFVRAA